MNSIPSPTGLQHATNNDLEQAAAENHRQLFSLNAIALGGEVCQGEGISWTYCGPANASAIMFPSLTTQNAGEQLDRIMNDYRRNPPQGAGYWSLYPPQPKDIGIRLLARGWQAGWQPCWMAKDMQLANISRTNIAGLQILADNNIMLHEVKDLPYSEDSAYMSGTLLKKYPDRAQRFIAFRDEKIVAQCCLFFSTGPFGIAGMYNVGVIPEERGKGIAKAIVLAACDHACKKGYRYVMLNANGQGRPVYEKTGFDFISYGITWWLMNDGYIRNPPSSKQIRFAEAIGMGDITVLEEIGHQLTAEDLNTPMANKMAWMQLAVHCHQPASAEWLITQGLNYTALDAWDLGWKEKAAALLPTDPEEVNRRYYDWGATLLHVAAERGDTDLFRLALAANPDLTLKDFQHDGTPMDWAMFFKRTDQVDLLRNYSLDLPTL